jgi:hypothetical protein
VLRYRAPIIAPSKPSSYCHPVPEVANEANRMAAWEAAVLPLNYAREPLVFHNNLNLANSLILFLFSEIAYRST